MPDWFRNAGTAFAVLLSLVLSCATERGTNGRDSGPEGTYIDEPIILAWSGSISPSEQVENEYVFDLSGDTLVKTGRCNDIFVRYVTNTSCDEDVEVWDCEAKEWRRIAYSIPDAITHVCFQSPREQRHALSTWGIPTSVVLDSASRLRVRTLGRVTGLRVWTLEINAEYWMIPLTAEAPYGYGGLAHVNGHFYTIVFDALMLGEVAHSGEVLHHIQSPVEVPIGLAFDGEGLWVVGFEDTLFKVSLGGEILCRFSLSSIWPGDLAWDGEKLWLSEEENPAPLLWGIDPVASCALGEAVITDTLTRPGGPRAASGLAWDGSHLLVFTKNSRLYRVERNGCVADSLAIAVSCYWGATWDGSRICLVSSGPTGPTGHPVNERTIACFKLRW